MGNSQYQYLILLLCAWILWHENEYIGLRDNEHTHKWETPTAYSTKEECEGAQSRVFGAILASQQKIAIGQADVKITSVPNALVTFSRTRSGNNPNGFFSWSQKLTCLPDTVNPK